MRTVLLLAAAAATLGLGACAEREQTANGIKADSAPFNGTSHPYVVPGWKPGDRASWEQQLKVRTVQGQNEYVKAP